MYTYIGFWGPPHKIDMELDRNPRRYLHPVWMLHLTNSWHEHFSLQSFAKIRASLLWLSHPWKQSSVRRVFRVHWKMSSWLRCCRITLVTFRGMGSLRNWRLLFLFQVLLSMFPNEWDFQFICILRKLSSPIQRRELRWVMAIPSSSELFSGRL